MATRLQQGKLEASRPCNPPARTKIKLLRLGPRPAAIEMVVDLLHDPRPDLVGHGPETNMDGAWQLQWAVRRVAGHAVG